MPQQALTNLGLNFNWDLAQDGWKAGVDNNWLLLDLLAQGNVLDKDLATPPGSPVLGDRYIIAASATGAWTGHSGKATIWSGTAWVFATPREGWLLFVQDEDKFYLYNGTAWAIFDPNAGLYQPLDSDLTSIAALSTTAYGRDFLTLADAAAARSYVGLGSGNNVTFNDLTVQGNLAINGTLTTVDTDNLQVEDSLIKVAKNNAANTLDLGMYGRRNPSGTDLYAGIFFDVSDNKWKLFDGLQVEPTTTVNVAGTGYTAGDLALGTLETLAGSTTIAAVHGPTANTGLTFPASGQMDVVGGGAVRWSFNGIRLLTGTSTSMSVGNVTPQLQVHGTAATGHVVARYSADANGPIFMIGKSRGATVGAYDATVLDDQIGALRFAGSDGTTLNPLVAEVSVRVNGTVATGQVPGRMDFSVANGSGVMTPLVRVLSTGRVLLGGTTDNGVDTAQINGTFSATGKIKVATSDELVTVHGNTGTTETFDAAVSNVHSATLDNNCTFTFSNPSASGRATSLTLLLTQDATGSRTVTWPASVKWEGGTAPVLSTAASALDVLTFTTVDGGTTWLGALAIKGAA